MAKVLLQHYLWLIDKLSKHPMTLSELTESFERSSLYESGKGLKPRTLYNWREKIEELFGIRIKYANETYRLENFERLKHNSPERWLLQSVAVSESVGQCHKLQNRILLENIPSGEIYLTQIIEAMKAGKVLQMTYHRFTDPSRQNQPIEVEPFCLKMNNRRWYMLCHVLSAFAQHHHSTEYDRFGALKIYALDRIQQLETTDKHFNFPEAFDPDIFFANHFGVCVGYDIPMQTVRLRASIGIRDYIVTLPLHHSQREVERTDAYSVFEFYLHPTIDFFRALLTFGADVEVLSPTPFREKMRNEAEKMKQIYTEHSSKK